MFCLLISELRESLSRVGSDLKQKFLDSLRSTWNSINEFARAHTSNQTLEQHVEKEMSEVINQLVVTDDESCETACKWTDFLAKQNKTTEPTF